MQPAGSPHVYRPADRLRGPGADFHRSCLSVRNGQTFAGLHKRPQQRLAADAGARGRFRAGACERHGRRSEIRQHPAHAASRLRYPAAVGPSQHGGDPAGLLRHAAGAERNRGGDHGGGTGGRLSDPLSRDGRPCPGRGPGLLPRRAARAGCPGSAGIRGFGRTDRRQLHDKRLPDHPGRLEQRRSLHGLLLPGGGPALRAELGGARCGRQNRDCRGFRPRGRGSGAARRHLLPGRGAGCSQPRHGTGPVIQPGARALPGTVGRSAGPGGTGTPYLRPPAADVLHGPLPHDADAGGPDRRMGARRRGSLL